MKKFSLAAIQKVLSETKLDGWLFFDFMGSDPVGSSILQMDAKPDTSRRWMYFIPARGAPVKLVHALESSILDHLPGKKEVYIGWKEMQQNLKSMFKTNARIAVQYSPFNAIPMLSRIDAGTFELLKSFKLNLVTSGDLVQQFDATLSKTQLNTHLNTAAELQKISDTTVRYIERRIKNHQEVTELRVQSFVETQLKKFGLVSSMPQIVASGSHSGNPRYFPTVKSDAPVRNKNLLQLSLRARAKDEEAVYASLSRVVYIGREVPETYTKNFQLLIKARSKALRVIDQAMKENKILPGWRVDDAARQVLRGEGLESYYLHRTGHSLGSQFYGHGVNLDNFETRDERQIIPDLCFTMSPGIYFSDYGMRCEINFYVDKQGAHLSTPLVQDDIHQIITT